MWQALGNEASKKERIWKIFNHLSACLLINSQFHWISNMFFWQYFIEISLTAERRTQALEYFLFSSTLSEITLAQRIKNRHTNEPITSVQILLIVVFQTLSAPSISSGWVIQSVLSSSLYTHHLSGTENLNSSIPFLLLTLHYIAKSFPHPSMF